MNSLSHILKKVGPSLCWGDQHKKER